MSSSSSSIKSTPPSPSITITRDMLSPEKINSNGRKPSLEIDSSPSPATLNPAEKVPVSVQPNASTSSSTNVELSGSKSRRKKLNNILDSSPEVDADDDPEIVVETKSLPTVAKPSTFIDLTLDSPPLCIQKKRNNNAITIDDNRKQSNKRAKDNHKQTHPKSSPIIASNIASTSGSKLSSTNVGLDIEEELSCPICCDLFVAPVNFSCGHSFCGSCAHDWLEKEPVCPSCRQKSLTPPARMYVLESIVQKHFDHQISILRKEEKLSEALAMELEREQKVAQWTDRRSLINSSIRRTGISLQRPIEGELGGRFGPRGLGIVEPYFGIIPPPHADIELAQFNSRPRHRVAEQRHRAVLPTSSEEIQQNMRLHRITPVIGPPDLYNRRHHRLPSSSSTSNNTTTHRRIRPTPVTAGSSSSTANPRPPSLPVIQPPNPRAGPSAGSGRVLNSRSN
ncbi:hypothetical protein CROQUDRAFT_720394 [Cronartium quercuum f. sp. fusiforme G11]|uniref:RING-type domain-containing protein n=1 Tax=Cronartium quercuum f. sp. fusiforme G11 TaxID=708437 RepID=A0A9P6NQK6_9BASI|nr:hypothetical protein CROQUDRAFT_720394 [Cronartium quercuum f. sp. fusiforme G11]